MSKSAGNVVLLSDVIAKGLDPLSLRLCFLENRYRSQMDLTWDALKAADTTLNRWRGKYTNWREDGDVDEKFVADFTEGSLQDIQNDLDTPRALQQLRKLEKDEFLSGATKAACFEVMDQIYGLEIQRGEAPKVELTPELENLLEARRVARLDKDFAKSDEIRDLMAGLGVLVKDTPGGQEWNWI
jgi:cysteinyl-tRNA synthetase